VTASLASLCFLTDAKEAHLTFELKELALILFVRVAFRLKLFVELLLSHRYLATVFHPIFVRMISSRCGIQALLISHIATVIDPALHLIVCLFELSSECVTAVWRFTKPVLVKQFRSLYYPGEESREDVRIAFQGIVPNKMRNIVTVVPDLLISLFFVVELSIKGNILTLRFNAMLPSTCGT
jgi:hypothetical protein